MEPKTTKTPAGYTRQFTDEDLRKALEAGITPAKFAKERGVSRQAVSKRVNQLQLTTASALVAPAESQRHVRQQIDVMEQLALNVQRANLLLDACDAYLRDADDPAKYDIGPRSEEVLVTWMDFSGEKPRKRKDTLADLLGKLEGRYDPETVESKHADPRELILRTQAEIRQHVALVMDAIQKLVDAQTMERWRVAVLEEIGKESPDCARRIAERVQRSIVLHAAFTGLDAAVGGPVH